MSFDLFPVFNKIDLNELTKIKFFCVFDDPGNDALIVTKSDKVYAFGKNQNGCLGLGHNNTIEKPELVKELCDQQIVDISYGDHHVLALTKPGKCFSWGLNGQGQLGNGTTNNNNLPIMINDLLHEKIIKIYCGCANSFVITESGELYGWGYNNEGETGCGNNIHQLKPIKINGFNGEKIVSITCGGWHSFAFTDTGKLYGWGWNSYGQLGNGNRTIQTSPILINFANDKKIKCISCGYDHSLFLTNDGDIYAFGSNGYGQIGKSNKENQLTPLKINLTQKFKEIACYHSTYISLAKADDNYCYVWGQCEKELFLTPTKTKIKSINEIFAEYSAMKITLKATHLDESPNYEHLTSNRLLENISKLFNDPKYSDLVIKIDNKKIFVHKLILRANCNYFEGKFVENLRAIRESIENKRKEDEIQITEYSYDVYYSFLKYLYTDCVDIESDKALNLLVLANDYKEEKLKEKCVDIIKRDNFITIENVCSLYCASVKYNLPEFEDFCFDYCLNKMNQIFKTNAFQEMDEKSTKKFMKRAAENDVFKT